MAHLLQCPKCGSDNYQQLENNRYKCNVCGTVFIVADNLPHNPDQPVGTKEEKSSPVNIIAGIILLGGIFAYGLYSMNDSVRDKVHNVKNDIMQRVNDDENDVKPKYTENTQSFIAVPGPEQPEIWMVKRRNSSDLKEVDYRISIENPLTKKEIYTKQVMNTITWDESFDKNFQVGDIKKAGKRCWLVIGGKELVGYDIASRQKTVDNQMLISQFHQFAEGISAVEDLFNIAGFKVTSKEGFTYYYLPEDNKVLTEVEYDNVRRNENTNNTNWAFQTQYVFSDGREQHLYKLLRRQQNLRMRKIYPNEIQNILNDKSLWYRKMYNVVSVEEFTPGKKYYNGNVLFNDNEYCVYICTVSESLESEIQVQCIDKNKKIFWVVGGDAVREFHPFLKAENTESFRQKDELVLQIPHQLSIGLNVYSGKINWKYKKSELSS